MEALDGSLRETEFIAPSARDGRPVFLVGDIWVQEDDLPPGLAGWKNALQRLQVGGERGYGWGRMQLETDLSQPGELSDPVVLLQTGHPITAHALAVNTNGGKAVPHVEGPVEPLVGWERKPDGRYGLTDKPIIAYAPGAIAIPKQNLRVRIGPYGIWEAAV